MTEDGDELGRLRSEFIRLRQQQCERLGIFIPAWEIWADTLDVPLGALRIAVDDMKHDFEGFPPPEFSQPHRGFEGA